MTSFFENTWFVWWVLAVVIILRWVRVMRLSETSDVGIDQAEIENKVH